jgi:alkylation response protein AidB-like acyl-CoA dehydrogenase
VIGALDPPLARLQAVLAATAGPGGVTEPNALLALDEREEFPTAAAALLDRLGVPDFYIDSRNGGRLTDLFDLTTLVRMLARHDLTLAVGHSKTFLGAVSVWLAGDAGQRARLAARIAGGAAVAWALTERGHGGDLLSGQLLARAVDAGWLLSGEKWLINNATRGQLVCVLARTQPAGGARGFSIFLFDKRTSDDSAWSALAKVPTHGIRGADISGLVLDGTVLPATAMVGAEGTGLETTLKALQLTRIVCCGLSLGALEHALALGADYVRSRVLYGQVLADIPNIRRDLGRAVAALRVAEAVTFVAARAAANTPGELAVVSAVAKAIVPELCQDAVSTVGEILGLRGFLSADEPYRAFQKIDRDHRVVAVFDGSTAVCRSALIEHFPILAGAGPATRQGLLDPPAEAMDYSKLSLLARSCSLVSGLAEDCDALAKQAAAGVVPRSVPDLAATVVDSLRLTKQRMAGLRREPHRTPQEAFDIARDFELCFAAAAVCRSWLHHEAGSDTSARPDDPAGLLAALALIVGRLPLRPKAGTVSDAVFDAVADPLLSPSAPGGDFDVR